MNAVGIALGAGVFGAIQPKVNAVLAERVGSSLVASAVNFAVALLLVVVALAVRPSTRRQLAGIGSWPVPWWTLTAGLGGAVVVLAGAVAVETIGVALFSIAFFAGQLAFGLIVDRLGVGPGGKRQISVPRVQAVVLAVVAVVISQVGRARGEFAPELVVFVVAAGAAVALQSAFNGRITVATSDAAAATCVNVVVGATALAAVLAVVSAADGIGPLHWPEQALLYTGGALGVTVVISLAAATAALGVLRTTVAMLAAQLITAFVVDWVIENDTPTPGVISGAVLIMVAVAIVGRQVTPVASAVD